MTSEKPANSPVDFLVVLGGDAAARAARTAELYHDQRAPNIIVSGDGDCQIVHSKLVTLGVPEAALTLECDSSSTWENAQYSVRLLRARSAKRAIIVTSWYHSRRALNCFEKAAPEIEFFSEPTIADRPRLGFPNRIDRHRVVLEYGKTLVYWIWHGVCPV
jgi:uncharacterized SAM-binding protein YcdF (DUF218 family)